MLSTNPRCNGAINGETKMSKPVAIFVVVGLLFIMANANREGSKETTTMAAAPAVKAAPVKTTAAEAAEIGDEVAVLYPHTTVMCSNRSDASKVYVADKIAISEHMRVENDGAYRAFDAGLAARKQIMRTLYSCEWAPRHGRYRVEQKTISGTEKDVFHTVAYCLRQTGASACLWLIEKFDSYSPFENVRKPAATKPD
jgi:hypothetical protein